MRNPKEPKFTSSIWQLCIFIGNGESWTKIGQIEPNCQMSKIATLDFSGFQCLQLARTVDKINGFALSRQKRGHQEPDQRQVRRVTLPWHRWLNVNLVVVSFFYVASLRETFF